MSDDIENAPGSRPAVNGRSPGSPPALLAAATARHGHGRPGLTLAAIVSATGNSPAASDGPRGPRRADARRNRELLLVAAKEVFSERGPDAPLDEVARRAGVASATLYRHFPNRRELLIAVYADEELTALCAEAEALFEHQPPGDALFSWLRAFVTHMTSKRDLILAIPGDKGDQRSALFDRWQKATHAIVSALLTQAQSARAVSADLSASDLLVLTSGVALATTDTHQAERCLALLHRGFTRSVCPRPIGEGRSRD
jgi:AcrR family transcriptional regulator